MSHIVSESQDEKANFSPPDEVSHFFEKDDSEYTPEQAMLDTELLAVVEANPKISSEQLLETLKDKLIPIIEDNLFGPEGFAEQRIETVIKRVEMVNQLKEKYEDPAQLYVALFGHTPTGEITLAPSAISIDFICENEEDFKHIYQQAYTSEPRNNYNSNICGITIKECLDPRAAKAVCAVKTEGSDDEMVQNFLAHESQHIKTWLYASDVDIMLENLFESQDEWLKQVPIEDETKLEYALVLLKEMSLEFRDKLELAAYIEQGLEVSTAVDVTVNRYKSRELLVTKLLQVWPDNKQVEEKINEIFADYDDVIYKLGIQLIEMADAHYSNGTIAMRLANSYVRQLVTI
jgi:hypothetical protein